MFDFLLPFLLVFAIVYGILSSTKFMGENKGVYLIVAFVIGVLSLRYQYFFSSFLSELFPRLGIGLAVILTVMILVGLFIAREETRYWGYGLAAIGVIIAIVVIYQSFVATGNGFIGGLNSDFVGFIILGVLLIGLIIAVAVSGSKGDGRGDYTFPGWGFGPIERNKRRS